MLLTELFVILIEMLAVSGIYAEMYINGNIRSVKYVCLTGVVIYLQNDLFSRVWAACCG